MGWDLNKYGVNTETKYGDLLCKSLYSVRMRETTDQK